jgi:hypothetical protein
MVHSLVRYLLVATHHHHTLSSRLPWMTMVHSRYILKQFPSVQKQDTTVYRGIQGEYSPGGGFVFTPVHNIQAGTPVENILAMFETLREIR